MRYRAKAKPQAGLVCHCIRCQRRSGSAFAFVAYFNEANVEFLQGKLTMYERSDARATTAAGVPEGNDNNLFSAYVVVDVIPDP